MRRLGTRKMWWVVVPCTRKKSSKTESRMDIEEILKMKLATIIEEEPETSDQENGGMLTTKHRSSCMTKKGKKIHLKQQHQQVLKQVNLLCTSSAFLQLLICKFLCYSLCELHVL